MNLSEFCTGISLMPEAVEELHKLTISESEYLFLRNLLYADRNSFYIEVKQRENFRMLFLYCFARMACETYEIYREKNISEQIYWDTFYDLTLWCENCRQISGEYGIEQYDWFSRHFELNLFRLGRLQFERTYSEWEIQTDTIEIHKGDPVISVHIPQGTPLDAAACRDAFQQAENFWEKSYAYLCHSWLLYPGLKELLHPTAHILTFQDFFTLLKTDYETREAEERIFIRPQNDPSKYAEKTSLQRAAKKYLLSGKKLGSGLGLLKKR